MKQKLYKDCLICKQPTLVRHISRLERTKFCSPKCRIESYKKEKSEILCRQCKSPYLTYPSRKQRAFCSSKCRYEWQASGNWPLAFYRNATEEQLIARLAEYLSKKTIKNKGCWEWSGIKDKNGYGKMGMEYKTITRAHRASWVVHKGRIPDGLWVLHKCDNPPCTNPEHLFLGTAKDNNEDTISKKRNNSPKGFEHDGCKFTEDEIKQINQLLLERVSQRKIASKFNVSQQTISRINTKQTYMSEDEQ